jgi:hypothetical protein
MNMKRFVMVVALSGISLLFACAASFNYKYYSYDKANGVLLGAEEEDDLPDTICDPRGPDVINCIVYRLDEHKKLKSDYLKALTELQRCRRRVR